ncbi:MAG: hypothetical protein ACXVHR_08360 [Methanobacterium sp.]
MLLFPLTSLFYDSVISQYTSTFILAKFFDLPRMLLTTINAGITISFFKVLNMESRFIDEITLNRFISIRRLWDLDELKQYSIKWLKSNNIEYTFSDLNFLIRSNKSRSIEEMEKNLNYYATHKNDYSYIASIANFITNHMNAITCIVGVAVIYWGVSSLFNFSFTRYVASFFYRPDQSHLNDTNVAVNQLNNHVQENTVRIEALQRNFNEVNEIHRGFIDTFVQNNVTAPQIRHAIENQGLSLRNLTTTVNQDNAIISLLFPQTLDNLRHLVPVFKHYIDTMTALGAGGRRMFPSGRFLYFRPERPALGPNARPSSFPGEGRPLGFGDTSNRNNNNDVGLGD